MVDKVKRIIIIGASYAGILALKSIVVKANLYKENKLEIIIIAPNDQSYYNIAAPRLLVEDEKIDQVFFPVNESIRNITKDSIHETKFIKGYVESINFENQTLSINNLDQSLAFDNLIIASGSRSLIPVWKLDNKEDQSNSMKSIKSLNKKIRLSQTIAVVGGGSTGVEIAGELKSTFKEKNVTIYCGSSGVLPSVPSLASKAEKQLKNLGIDIIRKEAKVENNFIECDDSTKEYDLVIQAQRLIPNTEFMPSNMLEKGFIQTDEYFRLRSNPNVICLGDVLAIGGHSLVDLVYNQKNVFEKVVGLQIFKDESISLQPYKKSSTTTMIVPIGKNGGVGALFGVPLPSILVWWIKSKDFMISKARDYLT